MFKNREDAGRRLGAALEKFRDARALVLAIPRGGVEVGYWAARSINAEFDLIISRKLPSPYEPEAGFGAVSEDGSLYILDFAKKLLSQKTIDRIIGEQKKEVARRILELRGSRPLPDMKERAVILVDDGIAMGATMCAAVMTCRNAGAARIIAAAPVAGARASADIMKLSDELVVLETPGDFHAVAQAYEEWHDAGDSEVAGIMGRQAVKDKEPAIRKSRG